MGTGTGFVGAPTGVLVGASVWGVTVPGMGHGAMGDASTRFPHAHAHAHAHGLNNGCN